MAFKLFGKKKKETETKGGITYYNMQVREVVRETEDAISIVFEKTQAAFPYRSGQFVTLIAEVNGESVRRAYSLCSSPGIDEFPAVTVKRVDNGTMSVYLNSNLKAGDELRVMQPMGHFTADIDPSNQRHLVLFGGGSGITPLFSILKSVLTHEPQSKITLVYANRNSNSIIFEDALDEWQRKHEGRLKIVHVLDAAPEGWKGHTGLMTPALAGKILQSMGDSLQGAEYYLCGPGPMMENVEKALNTLGVAEAAIKKESFVAAENEAVVKHGDGKGLQTRDVKIHFEGEEHTVTVAPDSSILETALDRGIDLPFSCQSGLCTACRCKLLQGEIKMDEDEGLSEQEMKDGYVLICVGHPLTDDVVISYD